MSLLKCRGLRCFSPFSIYSFASVQLCTAHPPKKKNLPPCRFSHSLLCQEHWNLHSVKQGRNVTLWCHLLLQDSWQHHKLLPNLAKFEAVREAVRATSSRRPYQNPGERFRPEAPLWPFPPAPLMSAQSIWISRIWQITCWRVLVARSTATKKKTPKKHKHRSLGRGDSFFTKPFALVVKKKERV